MNAIKKTSLLLTIMLTLFACDNQRKARSNDTVYRPNEPKGKTIVTTSKDKKELEKLFIEPKADAPVVVEDELEETILLSEPAVIKQEESNTNEYNYLPENDYLVAANNPLSTFSIDVDNASYSVVRQYLKNGQLPPKDAVRVEEMINYFDYNYKQPKGKHPFSVYTEVATSPWNEKHLLAMIGIKGKDLDYENIKASNLVFLIDTSGSMSASNKLPLLKRAFEVLLNNLPKNSKVSIVSYAGSAGLVLPATSVHKKEVILGALNRLDSGGSTAGGAGIKLAYNVAAKNFIKNGNNRVILATDGDFNMGTSSSGALIRMIQDRKDEGTFLSILGFGMGNYKDGRMEDISNAGNGNYFYIDSYEEAKKVFQKEILANLFTIAKDVKIQVEFNPAKVKGYRLIGYINRKMANKDFNDDKKDAGELGAGHTVTALYEIIPAGSKEQISGTDPLKYQTVTASNSQELMSVKLRYKPIKSNVSKLITKPVINEAALNWKSSTKDFQFASSVAGFGMLLRDSKYKGNITPNLVRKLAYQAKSYNDSYKNEYITLIDKYESIVEDTTENE